MYIKIVLTIYYLGNYSSYSNNMALHIDKIKIFWQSIEFGKILMYNNQC